jgi:RHS repeat-associated protein
MWSIVQAYSSSNTYTWTPAASDAGDHAVRVSVRNAGSSADLEDTRTLSMTIIGGSGSLLNRARILWAHLHRNRPEPVPPVSLSVRSVAVNSTSTIVKHSLYTPELSLMAETAESSSATPPVAYEYIWFGGQPVAQVDVTSNKTHWTFVDHLGTPVLQTSSAGSVDWRAEYEPFGSFVAYRTGATRHQPLRFPGQEFDENAGDREYNIFRWYREAWGRYTQADPIGIQAGLNVFAYVKDNPVAVDDPFGLVPVNYIGKPNREIQVDCKSSDALGCTTFDFSADCRCGEGCDRKTKKSVWAANTRVDVGPIRVYFSLDCYDPGKIILEEERHVSVYQAAIKDALDSAAKLNGQTFGSKADCEGACKEWLKSLEAIKAPWANGWIDFTHTARKCNGDIKW